MKNKVLQALYWASAMVLGFCSTLAWQTGNSKTAPHSIYGGIFCQVNCEPVNYSTTITSSSSAI